MLEIRLARVGKKNQPQYRIVVTNHTKPIKSNFIEVLGSYHPKKKNRIQSIKLERIKYWLNFGAHLSESTVFLLKPYLLDLPKFVKKEIETEKIKKEKRKVLFAKKQVRLAAKQEEKKKEEINKKVAAPIQKPIKKEERPATTEILKVQARPVPKAGESEARGVPVKAGIGILPKGREIGISAKAGDRKSATTEVLKKAETQKITVKKEEKKPQTADKTKKEDVPMARK